MITVVRSASALVTIRVPNVPSTLYLMRRWTVSVDSIGLELDVRSGLESVTCCALVSARGLLLANARSVLNMLTRMIWRSARVFIIEQDRNARYIKESVTGTVNMIPVMDPSIQIV